MKAYLRNEFISLVDKTDKLHLDETKCLQKVFHDRGVENKFIDLKYVLVILCHDDLELSYW